MDKKQLRITIVTPSFNQGRYIEEAIESVAKEHFFNLEHLIVDGGSDDQTLDVLKRRAISSDWKHVKWSSERDHGQSAALNKGFGLATGDIIGWLNSDDRYRPGCLKIVAQVFAENPEIDVIYGDYTLMDESGEIIKIRREIKFNSFVLRYHRVLYIPSTTTFFRRRIFADNYWLNEDFHYAMDADFFIRLAAAGYRFKHIPVLMADFRLHPESKSCAKSKLMIQEREEVIKKHSKALRRWRSPLFRQIVLETLKIVAAIMRYSEKMTLGHYNLEE